MSFKSRYGITKICAQVIDNLSISYDSDYEDPGPRETYPVFLYTPDMRDTREHFHIPLTRRQAKALHAWLGKWLEFSK
jgi:hypothetical protein